MSHERWICTHLSFASTRFCRSDWNKTDQLNNMVIRITSLRVKTEPASEAVDNASLKMPHVGDRLIRAIINHRLALPHRCRWTLPAKPRATWRDQVLDGTPETLVFKISHSIKWKCTDGTKLLNSKRAISEKRIRFVVQNTRGMEERIRITNNFNFPKKPTHINLENSSRLHPRAIFLRLKKYSILSRGITTNEMSDTLNSGVCRVNIIYRWCWRDVKAIIKIYHRREACLKGVNFQFRIRRWPLWIDRDRLK